MNNIDTISVAEVLNDLPGYRGRRVKMRGILIICDLENGRLAEDAPDASDPSRCAGLSARVVIALLMEANIGPYVGGEFMYNDNVVIEGLIAPGSVQGFPIYFSSIDSISVERHGVVTVATPLQR